MWLFIVIGLFVLAIVILISCLVIHTKSPYEEELELKEQEECVKQYIEKQKNKKNEN